MEFWQCFGALHKSHLPHLTSQSVKDKFKKEVKYVFDKRISIFTGHFGSGKTEVALNFACELADRYEKTAIIDFDIVNPFFRTADAKKELEEKGIWVILPLYANTNVDVPALPGEINTVFERKDLRAVFDVGGDDLGARAVSRYRQDIVNDDYEMFFVVNTNRPMTDTTEKIEEMICEIEGSARLKITGIVNNTNMLGETKAQDIIEGHKIIKSVSEKLEIPVKFISGLSPAVEAAAGELKIPYLSLRKLIKLPWQ